MKFIKLSLAAALIVTLAQAEETSDVGISANVAMTSNYVWRGMTQSDNSPAIQGGFDVDYKGVYAGVWGSNVNFGTDASMEFDVYAGYANEIYGIGYDIGYIQYAYPNDTKGSNFGEAYVGLSYDLEVVEISATASFGVDTDDLDADDNYEAGVSVPLPMDISLDATVGNYVHLGVYYSVGVAKTFDKFDLSLAYTGMDYEDSDTDTEGNVVATISASF
ncbi:MAG: TorF family putative porin [Campylobacterota bacterium]|nr:TorF family putative porin [Campylobacterota bacterium]